MPGKSRRSQGKHSARSKRQQGTVTRVAQQRVAPETNMPATPAPAPGRPLPVAKPTGARYPYIARELRTIGILAGIMLVVLVVLALVLP